jgi:FlaA1/EpsC-like NDP-sugar epimerase
MIKSINQLPKFVVFGIDIGFVIFSIFFSYLLRFNFSIPIVEINNFFIVIPTIIIVRIIYSYLFKTYADIFYYASLEDAQRIFACTIIGSSTFCILNFINHYFFGKYPLPFSVIIIDFIVCTFFLVAIRMFIKMIYYEFSNFKKNKINALIYGANSDGLTIKAMLESNLENVYNIIAFIDENPVKRKRKMEGITIYQSEDIEKIIRENEVKQLFFIQTASTTKKRNLLETCLKYEVRAMHVPPTNKWINGEISINQVKQVRIEDLLEREPIRLDIEEIKKDINNKVILITGAAGSIGSEIARQILTFDPLMVYLLDQAESPLFEIENELIASGYSEKFEVVLADIRNAARMEKVFEVFKPQMVFHAAAYKHVPLMENNPSESILTNVLGTINVANLSYKYHVEKMVMISTDKAVNPTGVMGASKRIAEIYVQSLNNKLSLTSENKTQYITTRFGNVLGSNGSVIPIFKKQIAEGGPVTVTHPEITRFFMTIPEACQLVLEAGTIGKGGEIFIFDMGESVKIADLAKKMIRLSGLELGKDIELRYTGLRPGEKLYEELLNDNENTIATHHHKIMKAKVREYDFDIIKIKIEELVKLFALQNNNEIVSKMKELVPEYNSQNSIYQSLDN